MAELLQRVEINPVGEIKRTVIWLHGLGADGHDFEPIVPELRLPPTLGLRFVFPHAPSQPVTWNNGMVMPAWYDIHGIGEEYPEDVDGYEKSKANIDALISREIEQGVAAENIVLAGFSQGGVIALHTALRSRHKLAGIVALSTYLGAAKQLLDERSDENRSTPIFMAHGQHDPVVPYMLGKNSAEHLSAMGYSLEWQEYPMEHSVCGEEISDIAKFFGSVFGI